MDEGDTRFRHQDRIIANLQLRVFGIGAATRGRALRANASRPFDREYPYIIVYRVRRNSVQIVRVLHRLRRYFN